MARGNHTNDVTTLQMALIGFQLQREKIDERIRELQSALKGKKVDLSSAVRAAGPSGAKRELSAAARRRIAAAQKKRWAEHRKRKAAAKESK